jgi:hypothetical protein
MLHHILYDKTKGVGKTVILHTCTYLLIYNHYGNNFNNTGNIIPCRLAFIGGIYEPF